MSQEFGLMRGFSGKLFQGGIPSFVGIIGSVILVQASLFTNSLWENITTVQWNNVTSETWN